MLCTTYSHEGRAFICQHEKRSIPPAGLPPRRGRAGSPAVHNGRIFTGRQFPTNHWLQWSPHIPLRLQRGPISIWRPWGQGKFKLNYSHIVSPVLHLKNTFKKCIGSSIVAPNGMAKWWLFSKQDYKTFQPLFLPLFSLHMHTIGWDQESKSKKRNNVFPLREFKMIFITAKTSWTHRNKSSLIGRYARMLQWKSSFLDLHYMIVN